MRKEEWANSTCAQTMLRDFYNSDPEQFTNLKPQLHRYLLACCWKIQHLIPQKSLRDGLLGAEKWLDGKISDEDLNDIDWFVEAEAFIIDYAKSDDEIEEINVVIKSIDELSHLPFSEARRLLLDAAYFVGSAVMYQHMRGSPYKGKFTNSQFLCPDLLRQYVHPEFPLGSMNPRHSR